MMPANLPHATLSLAPHFLYGQTFHVEGCARDPTSFGLELSAGSKPVEAIDAVLTSYKEGLQDADPRIRAIYIDRILCTMSAELIVMRHVRREPYFSRVVEVLRDNRKFKGVCGLCQHFRLAPGANEDCWELHNPDSRHVSCTRNGRCSRVERRQGLEVFQESAGLGMVSINMRYSYPEIKSIVDGSEVSVQSTFFSQIILAGLAVVHLHV